MGNFFKAIFDVYQELKLKKKYVNYWIVLLSDTFLSVISTLVSILFISGFIVHINKVPFIILLLCSGVFSLALFYFFNVHKNIIRLSLIHIFTPYWL